MIPDATLSSHDHGNCELCDQQEAEIRRRREWAEKCQTDYDTRYDALEDTLAAHQAVVRELADASQKYIEEVQANLRATRSHVPGPSEPPRWAALQHLQAWLADSLVVAMRMRQ